MMKTSKKGFTLAEVLTTLMVIGVVAAMTIPTLMNSTSDQQNKVAYKKAMSVLGQGAQLMVAKEVECVVQSSDDLADCFQQNVLSGTRGLDNTTTSGSNSKNTNVVITSDGMAYGFYFSGTASAINRSLESICGVRFNPTSTDDWNGESANCKVIVDTNGLNKGSKYFTAHSGTATVKMDDTYLVGEDKFPFILTGSGVTPVYVESTTTGNGTKGYQWIYGSGAEPEVLSSTNAVSSTSGT